MPMERSARPLRRAIRAVSAKCGAGASSSGGMHMSPEMVETVAIATGGEKRIRILRLDAGLLRLRAGIDLDEKEGTARLRRYFLGERRGKARPVDRMDGIEQRYRLFGLVRLQRTDEMQFKIAVAGAQCRPLGLGFLHPVFPEHPLPGGNHRLDRVGTECLRDRYQRYAGRIASGVAARARDFGANSRQPMRSIYAFHFVNARNGSILTTARRSSLRISTML